MGPRELCPCGSGRRYKGCHGRAARTAAPVRRPFEGLPGECDWIALREIVPAATAPLTLRPGAVPGSAGPADMTGSGDVTGSTDVTGSSYVTVSTVLPLSYPAMVRLDGRVFLGAQAPSPSGDPGLDLGTALAIALASPAGTLVPGPEPGSQPVRLQDLLDPDAALEVTVRAGFEHWLEGLDSATPDPDVVESMERANAAIVPTARLASVQAAYWAGLPERSTLRWVLPDDEEPLLDALARLHAGGGLLLGPGTRFIGTFRAHGLLAPVWDLPAGSPADAVEEPAAAFRVRLDQALSETAALTSQQRHARAGLQTRQLTLR